MDSVGEIFEHSFSSIRTSTAYGDENGEVNVLHKEPEEDLFAVHAQHLNVKSHNCWEKSNPVKEPF